MILGHASCTRYARARVVSLHKRLQAVSSPCDNISLRILSSPSQRTFHYHVHNSQRGYSHAFRNFATINNGGNDDDEEDIEWIPPTDSPLNNTNPDEIEVIDLEATLKNPLNQEAIGELGASEIPSEFSVESSDVSWKEILRELRDEGQTEMMEGLVKTFGLQNQMASLDQNEDIEEKHVSIASDDDGSSVEYALSDEEFDEEFEQSLQGLSQEELVDELIENSESFTELEMEIISSEMQKSEKEGKDRDAQKSEKEGKDGDANYDTLDEEFDWNTNSAYREFREMVLEDYNEKKQARDKKRGIAGEGKKTEGETVTNFSSKSDFTVYPSDWKDFDSNAAFQRDFSEDDDAWVPPSSEFIPSHTYDSEEKNEEPVQNPDKGTDDEPTSDLDNAIDWLQARRSRLGDDSEDQKPTHMMTTDEAETFRHKNSQIPVIPYTLLTTSEISASLAAQGGTDIHIIDATEFDSMQGVGMGCESMMLVTGRNASHIRVLADSIVRNLKARKLSERGVVGAMLGAEGGQDIFSSRRSRNRANRNGGVSVSRKIDDDWMVIDCSNIHVHMMEETTRKCLNVESLWDLSNPDSEGSKMRRVDITDDDAVDDYVAKNPIPDEYAAKMFNQGHQGRLGGWISGGTNGRVHAVPIFQSKSFSEKWSGVSKTKRKKRRGKSE